MAHDQLVERARQHLIRIGAANIEVLDGVHFGRKTKYKRPVPDIIATLNDKKIAVECGYLSRAKTRIQELRDAGYEIIIHFPYLECFDISMTIPYRDMNVDWRDFTK